MNIDIQTTLRNSGLTVKAFAASLYVSERTVYNWLKGGVIPRQKQKQIIDKYGERRLPTTQGEVDSD